jgi:TatD DNase family protein
MTNAPNGFDFHCHVDLFPDPAALIADCGRRRIVTLAVTTTPKAWTQNLRWTTGSRFVFSAAGLHPELAGQRHLESAMLETLIAETPFIGEIGLDGSLPHKDTLDIQTDIFTRALRAAQRSGGRVASIHSRRAGREVLACLVTNTSSDRVLPILHWFSDSATIAGEAVEQGCYFSINYQMLSSEAGIRIVKSLPLDRILTETDAPFTQTGNRNSEPKDVAATVEILAALRRLSTEEMDRIISDNARRVFSFAGISLAW